MAIELFYRIQVIGDKVLVPGHEPLSEQTSSALSIAMQNTSSYIDLDTVLRIIPNAKLEINSLNDGTNGAYKFLILPAGPPSPDDCPDPCSRDLYRLLQQAAGLRTIRDETEESQSCDAFRISKCDDTDFERALDPFRRSV